jgi:hypothetical protein
MLQRPHTELIGLADALQNAAEFYRQRTSDVKVASPLSPPYIALMMGWGAARNVDAVSILAKTDELLVPAAWSNARAACEIALRAIWLIHPADPMTSYLRLLAIVEENQRYHGRMLKAASPVSYLDRHKEASDGLKLFLARALSVIPQGYEYDPHVPIFDHMADEVGARQLSALYIEGSQYAHGGFAATALYTRVDNATSPMPAERVSLREWLPPLRICWLCLRELGKILTYRLSLETESCDWSQHEPKIELLFKALADADPSA